MYTSAINSRSMTRKSDGPLVASADPAGGVAVEVEACTAAAAFAAGAAGVGTGVAAAGSAAEEAPA